MFAQVVIGPPVAKAQFKHRPGHLRGLGDGKIQAGALRYHPVDKEIEPTHFPLPPNWTLPRCAKGGAECVDAAAQMSFDLPARLAPM